MTMKSHHADDARDAPAETKPTWQRGFFHSLCMVLAAMAGGVTSGAPDFKDLAKDALDEETVHGKAEQQQMKACSK
jgi:hypothetical protein